MLPKHLTRFNPFIQGRLRYVGLGCYVFLRNSLKIFRKTCNYLFFLFHKCPLKVSRIVCKLFKYRILDRKINGDDLNWLSLQSKSKLVIWRYRKIYICSAHKVLSRSELKEESRGDSTLVEMTRKSGVEGLMSFGWFYFDFVWWFQ